READVTTEPQLRPDWPQALHYALAKQAAAIRLLTVTFLGDAAEGPEVFRTDAARLEKADADLADMTEALRGPLDTSPEQVRRTRHDLMNVLNRLLGYSQLLLEAEEDEGLPPGA